MTQKREDRFRWEFRDDQPGVVYLYHGSKDETAPFEHVHLYAQAIPQAVVRRLSGRDHQLNNDMSEVAADIRRLGAVRGVPGATGP